MLRDTSGSFWLVVLGAINAASAGVDVALYAAHGHAESLGVGVFCSLIAINCFIAGNRR